MKYIIMLALLTSCLNTTEKDIKLTKINIFDTVLTIHAHSTSYDILLKKAHDLCNVFTTSNIIADQYGYVSSITIGCSTYKENI